MFITKQKSIGHQKRRATFAEASADSADKTGNVAADVAVTAEHFTRSSTSTSVPLSLSCFFCDKPKTEDCGKLHQATTFDLDARVHSCVHTLHDSAVIAKLSNGDMITIEARYHSGCLIVIH